jgi:hypothetical protein
MLWSDEDGVMTVATEEYQGEPVWFTGAQRKCDALAKNMASSW